MSLQLGVELAQAAAGRLQQVRECHASPSAPAQQDQRERESGHVLTAAEFRAQRQKAEADGVQRECGVRDGRRVADCADQERQEVVEAERALDPVTIEVAQEADEHGLHQRNRQRKLGQEDLAPQAPDGVDDRVERAQREDRVQDRAVARVPIDEVHQHVADAQSEPANADRHRLGGEIPLAFVAFGFGTVHGRLRRGEEKGAICLNCRRPRL